MIPFNKPFISGKELYYIADSVMKGSISGNGFYTKSCEVLLKKITLANKVLMTNSCTAALEMACMLINLEPGDEVIMPSYTFVSTANAVVLRGAVPVFCDIRDDTYNLDEAKIPMCISDKTKAIIPVHYAGQSCEMNSIMSIAHEHGLFVIEDAAQSVGAYQNGQHAGTIGDLGCFSFHETKNIMCGEGGALLINNPDFIKRAEIIREKGTNREAFFRKETDLYTWVDKGSSYLPSELQMAFLYAQLENLKLIIKRRRKALEYYQLHLKSLEDSGYIRLPKILSHNEVNYHLFALICRTNNERNQLIAYLSDRGVNSVFHYIPLHSSPEGKKISRIVEKSLPVTDKISECLLRIPVYYEITIEEQNYIISMIKEFFEAL
ncbi:MAG: dTDP-4-amino-4,6-dideoxygalactose transaminase [gamma proteobacterium symbiont of Taylorina sp.]|nr:dTDP-4-amino-4,6-dideoxygalactose transaminase [gamma proteobacterium symbiont of Taylorina sp.]